MDSFVISAESGTNSMFWRFGSKILKLRVFGTSHATSAQLPISFTFLGPQAFVSVQWLLSISDLFLYQLQYIRYCWKSGFSCEMMHPCRAAVLFAKIRFPCSGLSFHLTWKSHDIFIPAVHQSFEHKGLGLFFKKKKSNSIGRNMGWAFGVISYLSVLLGRAMLSSCAVLSRGTQGGHTWLQWDGVMMSFGSS